MRTEHARLTSVSVLVAISVLGGCAGDAQRLGEVDIYKVEVRRRSIDSAQGDDFYVLRGMGHTLSNASGTLRGSLDSDDLVGLGRASIAASELGRLINDSIAGLPKSDQVELNPKWMALTAIAKDVRELLLEIETENDRDALDLSLRRDSVLTKLTEQRNYLIGVHNDLDFLQRVLVRDPKAGKASIKDALAGELVPQDLLVEVFGSPLMYGEFWAEYLSNILAVSGDKSLANQQVSWKSIESERANLSVDLMKLALPDLHQKKIEISQAIAQGRPVGSKELSNPEGLRFYVLRVPLFKDRMASAIAGFCPELISDSFTRSEWVSAACSVQQALFLVCEQIFNIIEGVQRKSVEGFCAWDMHMNKVKPYSWEGGLDRSIRQVEVAIHSIEELLSVCGRCIRDDCAKARDFMGRLDKFTAELTRITGRAHNRQLRRSGPGGAPLMITVMLKRLYMKYVGGPDAYAGNDGAGSAANRSKHGALGEGGYNALASSTNLLATCNLRSMSFDANYPVLFIRSYAPGLFVPVYDRIIYGPAPYNGEFMDFKFAVVRPQLKEDEALAVGVQAMVGAVGKVNPEFAAISPAVSSFIGALTASSSAEQRELEVQWTIPGDEPVDSQNSDHLIAETGTYILIKTENPERRDVDHAAAERLLRSQLVFSPETGKLYYRRSFSDASRNYSEDNEFREKSYAVFSITDDYQVADSLGEKIRNELKRVVDEAVVDRVLPTPAQSAESLLDVIDLDRALQLAAGGPQSLDQGSRMDRETVIKSIQDQLWNDSVSLRRKQELAAILYRASDPEAQLRCGRDPLWWRREKLVWSESRISIGK